MKKSKNTESDLGDTSTPEKQPKENMEDDDDIYKDLATVEALNVVTSNNFCNPSTEIDKSKDFNTKLNTMKTQKRKKSIAKKLKTNEDEQKQQETPLPSTETTTKSTPTRLTKANVARGLHIQNTPPSENPPTTPQTETTNAQNIRNLSPIIQNDSTQTAAAKAVKIKDKIGKNPKTKVHGVEKEKEQVNKRKRDEKAKKEEQVKKKMVKLKGKKKVENDDDDFVVEE
ncbi:hypothetical protein Tco_1087438 [Tanacetum coccineum]